MTQFGDTIVNQYKSSQPFTANGYNDWHNATIFGMNIGKPSKKAEIKDQFQKRYGKKWQNYWEVYKKNGGDKQKLNKTWAQIEGWYADFEYKDKTAIGEALTKTARAAKKVGLVPLRSLFLLFIKMNVFNTATIFKLAKERRPQGYKKILEKYRTRFSGQPDSFDKQVEIGYKKKPIFAKQMKIDWSQKFQNAGGQKAATKTLKIPASVIGSMPAAGATAGAVIAPADPATKTAGGGTMGGVIGTALGTMFTTINMLNIPLGENESQFDATPEQPTQAEIAEAAALKKQTDMEAEKWSVPKWIWWTSGIVFAGIIATVIIIKVRKK